MVLLASRNSYKFIIWTLHIPLKSNDEYFFLMCQTKINLSFLQLIYLSYEILHNSQFSSFWQTKVVKRASCLSDGWLILSFTSILLASCFKLTIFFWRKLSSKNQFYSFLNNNNKLIKVLKVRFDLIIVHAENWRFILRRSIYNNAILR